MAEILHHRKDVSTALAALHAMECSSPGSRGRQTQQWPRSAEFRHRELTLESPAGGFF